MPIDPRIAMGFQPTTQLESPLNRLAKFQQIESGQRANELANMQMQEYQRGLQEQEDFRNMLAAADVSTPAGRSKLLSAGKPGVEYVKGLEAIEQGRTTQAKNQQELIKSAFQNSASALAQVNSFADAKKYIDSIYADPVIGEFLRSKGLSPESAQQKLLKIATGPDPEAQFNQWKFENASGIEAAQKQFGTQVLNTAGGVLQYDPRSGATRMIPGTSPADRPMTPAQSKDFELRATAAENKSAVKPLTEAQQIKARETIAKDRQVVSSIKAQEATMNSEIERLLKHPGLKGITGYTGMIPSLPASEAGAAENILEGIKGKVKTLGRELASQSGKLGNMAVQEWKFVSDAVAALDPRSKDFPNQLKLVQEAMKGLKDRSRAKFEETYPDLAADNAPEKPTSPENRPSLDDIFGGKKK
tara:strand:- start:4788 stop:6038 length:1251 start_codon:yes stop_codon:yes gene_type:complete